MNSYFDLLDDDLMLELKKFNKGFSFYFNFFSPRIVTHATSFTELAQIWIELNLPFDILLNTYLENPSIAARETLESGKDNPDLMYRHALLITIIMWYIMIKCENIDMDKLYNFVSYFDKNKTFNKEEFCKLFNKYI